MATAYATADDLAGFLPADVDAGATPDETSRLLARASELIDDTVRAPFTIDDDGLAVDEPVADALRDAVCAQVEYWAREVGEEHDVAGMGDRQVSLTGLSMQSLPPEVAPRALRALRRANLLSLSTATGYPAMAGWSV